MVFRSPISQGQTIIIADYKGFVREIDCLDHLELKTGKNLHTDTISSTQISANSDWLWTSGHDSKVEKYFVGDLIRFEQIWEIQVGSKVTKNFAEQRL
jgi:hypothetical protein